jgi:hypothetical protein
VRQRPAADAQGERELSPGVQVRVVHFDGTWAIIARDGQKLGYVPAEASLRLQYFAHSAFFRGGDVRFRG